MAGQRTPEKPSARPGRTAAAQLLNALMSEGVISMPRLAALARVSVLQLEACQSGERRLEPEEQMRLAAAVAALAPTQARRAHLLYGQAQAELRFATRQLNASTAQTDFATRDGSPDAFGNDVTRLEPTDVRAARARERAIQLTIEANRLIDAARALLSVNHDLRGPVTEVFRDEVQHFTVAARAAGETPERALALLKTTLEPTLAAVPDKRVEIMTRTVDWFVGAYYAE